MSDEEWNPDNPDDLEKTLELPSDEDERESSVNLSPDSLFYPSSFSGVSSAGGTPRRRTPRTPRASPRTRGRGRGRGTPRGTPRRLLAGRQADAPGIYQCPTCKRRLKTNKTYEKHVLNHKTAERARRRPSESQLKEECVIIAKKVVEEMKSSALTSDCLLVVEKVYEKVEESGFAEFVDVTVAPAVTILCGSKVVLPASIKQEVRKALHIQLSEESVRRGRSAKVHLLVEGANQSSVDMFLEDFCRRLVNPVAAFVIRGMLNCPSDSHVQQVQSFPHQDFSTLFNQQTLHRVAGFSVKGIIIRARQYKRSERWRKFREVVLGRLAQPGIADPNPQHPNYWTALLSHKSLMFVNDRTLSFFVEIAKVMSYFEAPDGCLSKSAVLAQVTSSPSIIALWGTLVGGLLDEVDSMFLVRTLVLSLCGTTGKGIMLRRVNQASSTSTG